MRTRIKAHVLWAGAAVTLALAGSAQAADDEVVIGFAVAESGWMNAYDGPPLKGAMMAIEDFNAKGGILGKQIRAVVSDTKTDTVQGAKAAAQVIAEGAQFMAVSCDYDMGAPAATVANDNQIIAIAFCASDAKMGVQGIGPYAFTMEIYGQGEGAVGAAYAWKRGWRKAYGLLDASIEYDKSICDGFLEYWKKLGGEVVGVDTFMQEDASIASQITRYKQAAAENGEPEVMMLCSVVPGAVSAIRQIRAAGIDVPIIGGDSMDGDYWVEGVPGPQRPLRGHLRLGVRRRPAPRGQRLLRALQGEVRRPRRARSRSTATAWSRRSRSRPSAPAAWTATRSWPSSTSSTSSPCSGATPPSPTRCTSTSCIRWRSSRSKMARAASPI